MIINGITYDSFRGNLCGADFSGADLSGTDFRGAMLRDTSFAGCTLVGADFRRADLTRADFTGANLTDAIFSGAHIVRTVFVDTVGYEPPCADCGHTECECMHCARCGDRADNVCTRCSRCSDCCNHYICADCDEPVDSRCDDCSRCEDCCGGHDDSDEFEETSPYGTFPDGRKRLAGIEYETTEVPDDAGQRWARQWSAGWHADGSCGYEAVTAPLAGKNIDRCITALADVIGETDKRCGIHVHVDARDFRWADTFRFLRVFAKVEGLLFAIAGQQRIENTYCEPCGANYLDALASDDPKNAVLAMAFGVRPMGEPVYNKGTYTTPKEGKSRQRNANTKKMDGRYKSVNIAPWVYGRRLPKRLKSDTTFEFRLHRNGDSAERVIGWTHLCVALVEWCARASDRDVKCLPKSALRALIAIAPGSRAWILRRIHEWRQATQGGVRRIDARTWSIVHDPQQRPAKRQLAPRGAQTTIGGV